MPRRNDEAFAPLRVRCRSAPVLGRSIVKSSESIELFRHAGHTHVAAPEDGRTPLCGQPDFPFNRCSIPRMESRLQPVPSFVLVLVLPRPPVISCHFVIS